MRGRHHTKDTRAYYEASFLSYLIGVRLWRKGHWGMHYGYYDAEHQDPASAVLNMNRVLAEKVHIQPGESVLDAGCGVGGSAKYLAQQYGANVVGITLSEQQARKARWLARLYRFSQNAAFFVRDFRQTGFPSASFDVVWAVESVNHAEEKGDFLREAWRLLKPDGRLIIADGFLRDDPLTDDDQVVYDAWKRAWAVPDLLTPAAFEEVMARTGFRNICFADETQRVLPYARWLYQRARRLQWLVTARNLYRELRGVVQGSGFTMNAATRRPGGYWQYEVFRRNIAVYGIVWATRVR